MSLISQGVDDVTKTIGDPHRRRRLEHEGRLPQSGIPSGPRDNPFHHVAHAIKHSSPGASRGLGTPGLVDLAAPPATSAAATIQSFLGGVSLPTEPVQTALTLAATHGIEPDAKYRNTWQPGIYDQIAKIAREALASKEGIHADPIAEGVISTVATLGLGGAAGLLRGGGEAAAGELAASAAGDEGSSLAARGAARLRSAARDTATAPVRAAQRLAATPAAVRDEIEALATSAGRKRAAARSLGYGAGQATDHPLVSTGALLAAAHRTGANVPGGAAADALFSGTANALVNDPLKVGETTARAVAGSVAALAGLGYSAGDSVYTGSPKPFLNTAGSQLHGLEDIAGKLTSGNEGTVQKSIEEEVGFPALPALPALHELPAVGAVRDTARDVANTARGHLNERFGTDYFRHGSKDQHVFGLAERHAQRKETAIEGQRATAPEKIRAGHERRRLDKAARKLPMPRTLSRIFGTIGGDAMQFLAESGITSAEQLDRFKGKLDEITNPDVAGKHDVNLSTVRKLLEDRPDLFTHEKTAEVKTALRKAEAARGHGNLRAQRLLQGHLLDVLPPELRTPVGARAFTHELERGKAWNHHDELRSRADALSKQGYALINRDTAPLAIRAKGRKLKSEQLRAKQLRGELTVREQHATRHGGDLREVVKRRRSELVDAESNIRGLTAEIKEGLAKHRKAKRDKAAEAYTQAKQLRGHADNLKRELRDFTRPERTVTDAQGRERRIPGQVVSSRARRKLFDEALEKEHAHEVDTKAAAAGLDKAIWTGHGKLRQEGESSLAESSRTSGTTVPHVRRAPDDPASLAARDSVDRSYRALVQHTGLDPRLKSGAKKFVGEFFNKHAIGLKIDGRVTHRVTQDQCAQAIKDGTLSSKGHIWVPEREYKQAFNNPYEDKAHGGYKADTKSTLKGAVEEAPHGQKGSYGAVVATERYKEFRAQLSPERWVGENLVNAVSKTAGRVLLFSPGWVESQIIAEAIPMVMANPRLINPAHLLKVGLALREAAKTDKDGALGWAGSMGESPSLGATASELRPNQQPNMSHFANINKAIEHNRIGAAFLSAAKMRPFVVFDQWRQGKYRSILAAAEVDRRLNTFIGGLHGAFRAQWKLSQELEHLPLHQQILELANNPRHKADLDKISDYVDDIAGNWTAFSRFERAFGPAAVFYGYIRYALRWPLTFAKHHPVSAEVNYFLAQQNANQLEKILGGAPENVAQFAEPVVYGEDGKPSVLPGGQRVAPGLSAPVQGLLTADAPAASIGSLNPAYGAAIGLVTGADSFGGHDENPGFLGLHWSLAAKSLISTPPILRVLGIGASHSQTAEELRANDSNKQLRSFTAPFLPESAAGAKANNDILKSLDEYEEGKSSGSSSSSSSTSTNPFEAVSKSLSGSESNPFAHVLP